MTNAERLEDFYTRGILARDCPSCEEDAAYVLQYGSLPMGPRHEARERCESGKRPHCSCDLCF
jgi:hypothetical protein